MKEAKVRQFHRALGIIVVWFLGVQALTGLVLAGGDLGLADNTGALFGVAGALHFGWNPLGSVYRLLLALTILAQGLSGIIIYYLIRARSRKV